MIEQWVLDKLHPLRAEPLIILRDPQRMILRGDRAVDGWAEGAGFSVLGVSGNLGLRELYEQIRDDPSVTKVLLVDRSRDHAKLSFFTPAWRVAAHLERS
jgi:hypothetical protein